MYESVRDSTNVGLPSFVLKSTIGLLQSMLLFKEVFFLWKVENCFWKIFLHKKTIDSWVLQENVDEMFGLARYFLKNIFPHVDSKFY